MDERWDKLSEAAGRFVMSLSRRKFVEKVGGACAGLAALLGLGPLLRMAFGEQVECKKIGIPPIKGPFEVSSQACMSIADCSGGSRASKEILGQHICEVAPNIRICSEGTPECNPNPRKPHKCRPRFEKRSKISTRNCRSLGQLNCPAGQVCCECIVLALAGEQLECGCDCIPNSLPLVQSCGT